MKSNFHIFYNLVTSSKIFGLGSFKAKLKAVNVVDSVALY